jgi:hypothetical protein
MGRKEETESKKKDQRENKERVKECGWLARPGKGVREG